MLDAVMAGDAAGLLRIGGADGDARRICGLSPIYAFLRALPGRARPAHSATASGPIPRGRSASARRHFPERRPHDLATDPSTWKLPRLRIDRDGALVSRGAGGHARGHSRQPAGGSAARRRRPLTSASVPCACRWRWTTCPSSSSASRQPTGMAGPHPQRRLARDRSARRPCGSARARCRTATVKDGRFEARLSRAAAYQLLRATCRRIRTADASPCSSSARRRWVMPRRSA